MSVTGFDEISRKLTELSNNAQKLAEKDQNIPLSDLLTPEFLAECSEFSSVEEMFDSSGFKIDTLDAFSAIPPTDWDKFVQKNTAYESWDAMLGAAAQKWTIMKLGF